MKRLTLICAVAAVIGVWPAASSAATFNGVVVAKQRGALLVATPAGVIRAVSGSAAIGSRVASSGGHVSVIGRAHTAHIRGIVVRRVGATMFLSSNRHLVAVHTGTSTPGSTLPPITTTTSGTTTTTTGAQQPGAVVSSQVSIQNGELDEDSSQTVGQTNASDVQVQALVSAVGAGTVTLTVGTQTLTVPLPAGLTLPASIVGQTVTLSLSLNGLNGNNSDDNDDDGGHGGSGGHGGGGDGGSDG
ncbi:MAG TPA: hypothetical protein VJ375_01885 [Gaiellaceae bacterium]|nr:hypothetical protein [Gaiellaceae bacterium]